MSRNSRGATLVETMVAITLLALATTLLAGFFRYFTRQTLRYNEREELMGNAERAVARIQTVLGESRTSNVVFEASIAGIYFPSAENSTGKLAFDTAGALTWQSWQAIGYDASSLTVYEASRALGTDVVGKAPSLAPSQWARKTLTARVRDFSITGPGDGVYQLRLTVRDAAGYQAEFVTSVRPIN